MGERKVVETIHGKRHKYDIIRESPIFLGKDKFYVWRDGEPFRGAYSTLAAAVEAARKAG